MIIQAKTALLYLSTSWTHIPESRYSKTTLSGVFAASNDKLGSPQTIIVCLLHIGVCNVHLRAQLNVAEGFLCSANFRLRLWFVWCRFEAGCCLSCFYFPVNYAIKFRWKAVTMEGRYLLKCQQIFTVLNLSCGFLDTKRVPAFEITSLDDGTSMTPQWGLPWNLQRIFSPTKCEIFMYRKNTRNFIFLRKKIQFRLFSLCGVAKLCWFHQCWLKLYCKHFYCVDFLSRCWLNQIFRIYDCYAVKIPTRDLLFICILIIFSAFAFFIFPANLFPLHSLNLITELCFSSC